MKVAAVDGRDRCPNSRLVDVEALEARAELAEGEAGSHAGFGNSRGRVGQWTPPGLAEQSGISARCDVAKGGFAMLGKTFKGLTDEMLKWQTAELLKLEIARDKYTVYVEPKLVVEIAFNEIQVSRRYASGLALRFAREALPHRQAGLERGHI